MARDPDTVAGSKVPYFKVTKLSSFSSLTVRVGRPTTHSVLSAAIVRGAVGRLYPYRRDRPLVSCIGIGLPLLCNFDTGAAISAAPFKLLPCGTFEVFA